MFAILSRQSRKTVAIHSRQSRKRPHAGLSNLRARVSCAAYSFGVWPDQDAFDGAAVRRTPCEVPAHKTRAAAGPAARRP